MRVLITGHDGYIGAVMVPVMQAAGHEVVGLDTGFFEDCGTGVDYNGFAAARKDIRDVTPEDLQGVDAVAHLAALCNDPLGNLNADWTHDINHRASVRLAEMARAAGVRRFIYASSCSMYGAAGDGLINEEAPLHPLTPYAVSKVRAEEDISALATDDFSPVFMRNATAYGMSPRLRADVVLNNLVCWAYTTGKIRIMSDGTPWRPIVHIEDISRAFAAAMVAPREAIHNQAFNVGANEENYQVSELAEIVRETVPGCTVEYAEGGGPDPRSYRVDFTKLNERLPEFRPKWDARRGAQELYDAVQGAQLTAEEFQNRKFTRLVQFKYLLDSGRLDDTLRWR
ncbi:MAG TPA: SDR family oxidoreductase [Pyrinomonadaceae bacterium]|jgi:nucleoside-diphosphate-sugar epimerase|nr:SDR family oxidoreductase [Pyrinomonadaceae bacterium]